MTASFDMQDLLAEVGDRLYGLCVRLDDDPADAYGAACEHLWKRSASYDPDRGTLRAWAVALTHRLLIDRHRRRRVVVPLEVHEPRSHAHPERDASENQRRAHLEQALARLDPNHRRVIVLHHLEGLALTEIATHEGVAVGTIKSRLHRARGHLTVLLQEHR